MVNPFILSTTLSLWMLWCEDVHRLASSGSAVQINTSSSVESRVCPPADFFLDVYYNIQSSACIWCVYHDDVSLVYNIQYTIYNIQYTIYNIQYTIYNIQYTIYNIPYTIYNIQYTIYNIQYTIYNIQYTIYNIQYTIYNIQYMENPKIGNYHTLACPYVHHTH